MAAEQIKNRLIKYYDTFQMVKGAENMAEKVLVLGNRTSAAPLDYFLCEKVVGQTYTYAFFGNILVFRQKNIMLRHRMNSMRGYKQKQLVR